jgi:hypothetical protein
MLDGKFIRLSKNKLGFNYEVEDLRSRAAAIFMPRRRAEKIDAL